MDKPTDWRALCAELFEIVEDEYSGTSIWAEWRRDIRAALAQPEPVGPTDEELLELMPEAMRDEFAAVSNVYSTATGGQVKPGLFRVVLNTVALEYARAVLARWGNVNTNQQHD